LLTVMGAGACARGWTVSYRLAEVLTLAAAPRDRALAAARGVRPVHRRRQRPVPACTAPPGAPPIRTLLTTLAPRRWSGTGTRTRWTLWP